MKKLLLIALFTTLFSCADGDVIVTSFNFDDASLQACGNTGGYLFFKIGESGTESISVRLGVNDEQLINPGLLVLELNGSSNFANYRIYDATVTNSYFCNEIPPTSPGVTQEYVANSGSAEITRDVAFDDADGLPFVEDTAEDMEGTGDFDEDGIPNYYDFDDDGDNVPTSMELDILNEDGDNDPLTNPLDTDGDLIPDYLDTDDDGDGVPTRYEANGTLDPTLVESGLGGPDYLNPQVSNSVVIDEFREHNYNFVSDIDLVLKNLVLISGEEEITRETLSMDGIESILNGNLIVTPLFPDN